MKLLPKFGLTFVVLFAVGIALAGVVSWNVLMASARAQVLEQAKIMTTYAAAMRTYTENQIVPISQSKRNGVFRSQWIPFYAATQMFTYARSNFPDYTYKEAALNPTDLRDRAEDWEADIINAFRDKPGTASITGDHMTGTGRSLFVAKPIVADATCLSCHGDPSAAPAGMVKLYGMANGFRWNPNEIIGAEIVSIPTVVVERSAKAAFINVMIVLAVVAIVILAVLAGLLNIAVVTPIVRISREADEISQGRIDDKELDERGKDEIAGLAQAFNRMTRSLRKAMRLLESSP